MAVARNITGLNWHIDNNVLTREESLDLFRMAELGWLSLGISSRIEVEHLDAKTDEKKMELAKRRMPFVTSFAPLHLGHSILGSSVVGSDEDDVRLERVFKSLWPNADFDSDRSQWKKRTMGRSRFRDSLLVSDAIRYCASAFVTHDPGILEGSERIRNTFDRFDVISIEAATQLARSRIEKSRRFALLQPSNPSTRELPTWP